MEEDELRRIHARLIAGEPTASLDLVEGYAPHLSRQLSGKWPTTPRELREEAVVEALFGYLRAPHAYDPSRGSLGRYLFFAAHRDLQNIVAREERQRPSAVISLDRVEVSADGRKSTVGERVADPRSDPGRWLDEVDPGLLRQVADTLPDARDRQIFALIAAGERRTEVFAAVLGVDGLAPAQQQRAVKRAKDRVLARVRRRVRGAYAG